ncbi:MAG: sulfite exporter TauE/SafE family protein [Anaerolineales bacterium]|jgi:sulfite exporter TauE/SafE
MAMISALFLSGLLGSLGHCLGMCGPLVLMVGAQFGGVAWTRALPRYLLYHASRIVVYGLLGSIAGVLGSLVGLGGGLNHITGTISLILGAGIILLGLRYLGWLPLGKLEGSSEVVGRMMNKALRRGGLQGLASLGALNGLLPCGLVYSALLAAAATGAPLKAAVAMVAFGAGTLPALLVLGLGAGMLSIPSRQFMSRVAGLLVMLIGVQLILRGAAGLGWMGHWKPAGLMIF